MLEVIFKKHLKSTNKSLSKRQIINIQRSNKALLTRISKCLNTLLENQAGVDYFVPIYGNNFKLDNKVRHKTLKILVDENIIQIKTNIHGNESWVSCWKYNKQTKQKSIDTRIVPKPKSYCFTQYGWSLVQQQELVDEIKSHQQKQTSKYQSPEDFANQMLRKAAEDNLSLTFKLTKPLPTVVDEYLEAVKDEWKVTSKNYKYKYKQAERVVLNTIHNFNNKLLTFKERLYTALSLCPKELRQYILTPDGQQIDQGFDIRSSIYTLLGDTLEYYMVENNIQIPAKFYEEKKKLQKWCLNKKKHIYVRIGEWNGKHYTKEQIKPHNMQVLFSNNKDFQSRDEKNTARNQIKDFIQTNLPIMYDILLHFEEEENTDYVSQLNKYNKFIQEISLYNAGLIDRRPVHVNPPKKVKSTIWRYFHRVETFYELKLKQQLEAEDNNITAYWIHDCLCFKVSSLTSKFKTHIQNTFKHLLSITNITQIVTVKFKKDLERIKKYSLIYGACVDDVDDNIVVGEDEYKKLLEEIDEKSCKYVRSTKVSKYKERKRL